MGEMHQKMWKTYRPILEKHCASVEKLLTRDEGRYGSAHCVSLVSSIQKSKYYVAVEVGQGTSEGCAFKTVEDKMVQDSNDKHTMRTSPAAPLIHEAQQTAAGEA